MYLNDKEESIIGNFMNVADEYEQKEMILKWENGSQIHGIYDSYMEDETDFDIDDREYQEFWSFVFSVIDLTGDPPVYITEDEFFCVDYRNFPDEIIADGKKIN
ncbi:MAG: hypothetical protein IJN62_03945 [Clostridia bacterium]|nr:hypothetical protein [Clostridia bacterium]